MGKSHFINCGFYVYLLRCVNVSCPPNAIAPVKRRHCNFKWLGWVSLARQAAPSTHSPTWLPLPALTKSLHWVSRTLCWWGVGRIINLKAIFWQKKKKKKVSHQLLGFSFQACATAALSPKCNLDRYTTMWGIYYRHAVLVWKWFGAMNSSSNAAKVTEIWTPPVLTAPGTRQRLLDNAVALLLRNV